MLKKIVLVLLLVFIIQIPVFSIFKYNIYANKGYYHIVIPYSVNFNRVNFVLSEELITNRQMHKKTGATFTVNTGFFDPNNQKTISYIYTDGILAESPLINQNLLNNSEIMANWGKISNRVEFRVTKNEDNKYLYDIAFHDEPLDGELITSAQGGPMLLPEMDLEKEYFIVKDEDGNIIRESASVLHKTARTLIGLKGKNIHIFIITDKCPMTIYEARDLCKSYHLDKAMAFDGGSSTSFDYKRKIHVVSTGIKGDDTGRKLKSFLIFK